MSDASDAFRLPVRATLRDVFRFLWSTRRDLALIGAIPVVLLTLWQVVATRLIGIPDPAHPVPGAPPATLWDVLLIYGPDLLLYVMFAVAWHRRYLAAEETATVWSALRWDRRKTRFLGRSVLVGLIAAAAIAVPVTMLTIFVVILNLAASTDPQPMTEATVALATGLVGFAALTMFLLVYLRLSVWLPPAAVDAPFDLLESWRLGRENSWRLLAIAVGAEMPVALVFLVWGAGAALLPAGSVTVALIVELVRYALSYLGLAAGITALSVCYDRLLARIATDPLYTRNTPFRGG